MRAAQLRTRRLRGSSCWGGQLIHCDRAAHPQDARDRAADAARLRASACGGTRISDTYPPYLRRGTRISDSYPRMRVAVIISTCIAPRVRTGASYPRRTAEIGLESTAEIESSRGHPLLTARCKTP